VCGHINRRNRLNYLCNRPLSDSVEVTYLLSILSKKIIVSSVKLVLIDTELSPSQAIFNNNRKVWSNNRPLSDSVEVT
jgi:hypothetical protein